MPECFSADRLHAVINIMIQELSPLHHHLTELRVQLHTGIRQQTHGHQPGVWHLVTMVESVRIVTHGSVETILIVRRQETSERSE